MQEFTRGNVVSYIVGFILSIVFTIIPFLIVFNHMLVGWTMVGALVLFAILQLLTQLVFFLHIGNESKPRFNAWTLSLAGMVVVIVVIGSLWIMKNLDYNMTSAEMDKYMIEQSKKGF
jgi:cytochrome o ubiquinol oxidase operon protein cyoD